MKKITQEELDEKIKAHKRWLDGLSDGEHLVLIGYDLRNSDLSGSDLRYSDLRRSNLSDSNLRNSDLRYSDLSGTDLRNSDLRYSDLRRSNLSDSNLRNSDLRYSDLRRSNLRGSNLSGSNLSGSDLDFSAFPLWCGGSRFKCSEKLVRQLFAHICTLEIVDASDEMKKAIKAIRGEALKSHRAGDLGLL
jgi:hypothetical protein